jgi:hypothetical protein
VIQPEPVDRPRDQRHIACLLVGLDRLSQRRRIAGEVLRTGKSIIPVFRKALRGICIVRARGKTRLPIVDRPKGGIWNRIPQHVDGCTVAEINVMDGLMQGSLVGNPCRRCRRSDLKCAAADLAPSFRAVRIQGITLDFQWRY